QVAGREHYGVYTKSTSPVRDTRARTTGRPESMSEATEAEKKAQTLPPPAKTQTPSTTETSQRLSTLPPKPTPNSEATSPPALSTAISSNSSSTNTITTPIEAPIVPTLKEKSRRSTLLKFAINGLLIYSVVPSAFIASPQHKKFLNRVFLRGLCLQSASMGELRMQALEDRTMNLQLAPAAEKPVETKKRPVPEAPVIVPKLPTPKPLLDEDYDDFSSIPEFVAPSGPA
ncbi:unnamed protein product, partial [Dibothriocephalus latus]